MTHPDVKYLNLTEGLNLDARYTVSGYRGIAFYLLGYTIEEVYDEEAGDTEVNRGEQVRVVMVGDDRVHEVDPDDLTEIPEEAYCHECGQIGCTADGRTIEEEEAK